MGGPRGTCRVIVLGSRGSIGTQTLEVIGHLNALHLRGQWGMRFEVVGLAARKNAARLEEQAERLKVRETALSIMPGAADVGDGMQCSERTLLGRVLYRHGEGEQAGERLGRQVACDLVVAAMSG